MKEIYVVISIGSGYKDPEKHHSRTWAWYESYKEAVDAIRNNRTDIYEAGWYEWALIERVSEGLIPITTKDKCQWFVFDGKTEKYVECDEPERFSHTINWSFG